MTGPSPGKFLVAHDFAFDRDHLLCSVLTYLPADNPKVDSISDVVPGANWAEREIRDLVGIEPVGHPYPKRLVLPDGWPDGVHPLRKDVPWNQVPEGFDEEREFKFDEPPEGCTVVPFGPFHPTLDEPAHFRLYVEGEMVRGCEYRGFMVHRGIEKLAESVLTYNDIPMMAERICGICGCVHNVAYAQAVESGRGPAGRRRAPNTSAPSCSRSSACTATCSGSGWPATSSASTRSSCRACASASRSCGSRRRSAATARPTPSASSAACAGTSRRR